jgi:hypothetical protein
MAIAEPEQWLQLLATVDIGSRLPEEPPLPPVFAVQLIAWLGRVAGRSRPNPERLIRTIEWQ